MNDGLGAAAARGVFWTGLGQILRQIVQVVGSIALARLLTPDDFGLVGMAWFFVGLGQLFADFGMGWAIVHSRSTDRTELSSCFWLNLAVAGGFALAIAILSPQIAAFYRRADLAPLVAVISLSLLLSGLGVVPSALLSREMRFAELAQAQVLGALSGTAAAIALAWHGAGAWALVTQILLAPTIGLLLVSTSAKWYPAFVFSWSKVTSLAKFGVALLGSNLVGYANRNADTLLVGRFLGSAPLGVYSMAMQLMLYPLQHVSSVFVRVLFPTLAQIRDDLPRVRAAYLRAVGAICVITFPMMGGLFAVADDFVTVVFGPGWSELAPVLKVLAWVGMLQSIGTTVGTIYLTMGKPQLALRVSLAAAPVLIGGIAAGLPWGILGVAIGYGVASCAMFYTVAMRAFSLIELKLREFHAAVYRPFLATIAMVVAVVASVQALSQLSPIYRLVITIVLGVGVYAAMSAAINRKQLLDLWNLVCSLRRKQAAQLVS